MIAAAFRAAALKIWNNLPTYRLVFTAAGIALALLGLMEILLRPAIAAQAATEPAALQTSAG